MTCEPRACSAPKSRKPGGCSDILKLLDERVLKKVIRSCEVVNSWLCHSLPVGPEVSQVPLKFSESSYTIICFLVWILVRI